MRRVLFVLLAALVGAVIFSSGGSDHSVSAQSGPSNLETPEINGTVCSTISTTCPSAEPEKAALASIISTADDRVDVAGGSGPGGKAPYAWVASLDIDGVTDECTGFFVGPSTVITAGHCLYTLTTKTWAKTVTVKPGYRGQFPPASAAPPIVLQKDSNNPWGPPQKAKEWWTVLGWMQGDFCYDYGAVILNRPAPDNGFYNLPKNSGGGIGFPFADLAAATVNKLARLSGYPGDKLNPNQWYDGGGAEDPLVEKIANDDSVRSLSCDAHKVTGATNAAPIVITTSGPHNLQTGQTVMVSGATGNTAANNTPANPAWTITKIDDTHFSLNGSTGNGAYINGGTLGPTDLLVNYKIDMCGGQSGAPVWVPPSSSTDFESNAVTAFAVNDQHGNGATGAVKCGGPLDPGTNPGVTDSDCDVGFPPAVTGRATINCGRRINGTKDDGPGVSAAGNFGFWLARNPPPAPVGGTADLQIAGSGPAARAGNVAQPETNPSLSPGDASAVIPENDSGFSTRDYAAIAVAAFAISLMVSGWYARRRWRNKGL